MGFYEGLTLEAMVVSISSARKASSSTSERLSSAIITHLMVFPSNVVLILLDAFFVKLAPPFIFPLVSNELVETLF